MDLLMFLQVPPNSPRIFGRFQTERFSVMFVLDVAITYNVLMVLMKKIVKLANMKKMVIKRYFVKPTKNVFCSAIYVTEQLIVLIDMMKRIVKIL